jgi:hypothetical protein
MVEFVAAGQYLVVLVHHGLHSNYSAVVVMALAAVAVWVPIMAPVVAHTLKRLYKQHKDVISFFAQVVQVAAKLTAVVLAASLVS